MMEDEVVTKRQWMTRQEFLDLVGATNLIPGPNSTEMAFHCGLQRGGVAGLFVAGICFLFPAILLTGLLAYVYVEYGQTPELMPLFWGIKPAVLVIILGAVIKLGKKALKGWELGVIGVAVIVAALLGVQEVLAILGGGLVGMLWLRLLRGNGNQNASPMVVFGAAVSSFFGQIKSVPPEILVAAKVTGAGIFFTFLKIGAILFGSGYVLVAYLEGELVDKLHWLTQPELLDAVAMGQFTPGPVLSTATFVGYQVSGWSGALLATAGIFLPSFLFVLLLNPIVPKMRQSAWARAFLDAVNVSAVGIMVAVLYSLGVGSLVNWQSFVIAGVAAGLYFGWKKLSVMWIVLVGAGLGYLLSLLG